MKRLVSLFAILGCLFLFGYINEVFAAAPILPDHVVDIKTLAGVGISGAFDLEAFNEGPDAATTYAVVGESRNWGAVSISTVAGMAGYLSKVDIASISPVCSDSCYEWVYYKGENEGGEDSCYNILKYSTYLWKKIPPVILKAGSSNSTATITLTGYVIDDFGGGLSTLPASFGYDTAIKGNFDPAKLSVEWADASTIVITQLVSMAPADVIIVASPNATEAYECNFDRGVIQVAENLVEEGYFDSAASTTKWAFLPFGGASPGTYSWLANYAGRDGVIKISQAAAEKMSVSQIVGIEEGKWYTVKADILSDASTKENTQKVYIQGLTYLPDGVTFQDSNAEALQAGQLTPNAWTTVECSFYSNATKVGVNLISIVPAGKPAANLYVDKIELAELPPAVEKAAGATKVAIANADFKSDLSGWFLFGFGGAAPGTYSWSTGIGGKAGCLKVDQVAGNKLAASQFITMEAGKSAKATMWAYSTAPSMASTQKLYILIGVYDSSTTLVSNLQCAPAAGSWEPNTWKEVKIAGPLKDNIVGASFIVILPAGAPSASAYIDDIRYDLDQDEIYWFDSSLTGLEP